MAQDTPRKRILVVDDSPLITKMLHVKLGSMGFDIRTAADGLHALQVIQEWLPDLIISDVMMPNMGGYDLTRTLRRRPETANIPVLLLTAQSGVTEKVAGFEAGADDYVTKPFDFLELEVRLRSLLARAQAQRETMESQGQQGELFACFSPRGGVGTTTVAVNLAVLLAKMWEADTALVDLALPIGQVAVLLDLRPSYTLGQMAQENLGLDQDVVSQALVPHQSGVRVLSAPSTPELSELITATLIERILPILQDKFAFVVVDAGRNFIDSVLSVLERADRILLPVSPDLASLQATVVTLKTFRDLEIDMDRVWPILTWIFPQKALPQKEMERAIGIPIRTVIPYDSKSVVQSINQGIPLVTSFGKSPATLSLEEMAYTLTAKKHLGRSQDSVSALLQRVQKRLQGKEN